MGISKYSKYKKEAFAFIEWFQQKEQQMRYSVAGQSGRLDVLQDKNWQNLTSWNKQFSRGMSMTNDYWHIPEYIPLLEILQKEVVNAVVGIKTVTQAMNDAAVSQEQLLISKGYRIDRTKNIPVVPDTIVTPGGGQAEKGLRE